MKILTEEEAAAYWEQWKADMVAMHIEPIKPQLNLTVASDRRIDNSDPDANVEHWTRAQGHIPGGVGPGMDPQLFRSPW